MLRVRGGRALAGLVLVLGFARPGWGQASFYEGFENPGPVSSGQDGPSGLIAQGWIFRNQSQPEGHLGFYGADGVHGFGAFPPHTPPGYLAADQSALGPGGGQLSVWAILPPIPNLQAGDQITVYARRDVGEAGFEIRYSPSGGTSTGSGPTAVGDFTVLLLDVPSTATSWQAYTATVPGPGRLALRYKGSWSIGHFSPHTGFDSLSVGPPPPPPCNLPPAPQAGQTVVWTASGGPYEICQAFTVPAGATVVVEPGTTVTFDPGMTLTVEGTLQVDGTPGAPVTFVAPAVFPPMIHVVGSGVVDAAYTDFQGQVRNEASVVLDHCTFQSSVAILDSTGLADLTACTFSSPWEALLNGMLILREGNMFTTVSPLIGGYVVLRGTQTFQGVTAKITHAGKQPLFVDGLVVTGSPSIALQLSGNAYLLGPDNTLSATDYPVSLNEASLLPGSVVPSAGAGNNAVLVLSFEGRLADVGVPYHLSGGTSGDAQVDPGVTLLCAPGAGLTTVGTRRLVLEGLPDAPIEFLPLTPGGWDGMLFASLAPASPDSPRLEYCVVEGADFGVIASDAHLRVSNFLFRNNAVGANANTFGSIRFAGTRFTGNDVGVSMTDIGTPDLNRPSNPNSFEGNGLAINALEIGSSGDARNCWWGDPSGPVHPANPGGQGDAVGGPGASGVQVIPFLTAPPDESDAPPVVRIVEPGYGPHWRGWALGYAGTPGMVGYLVEAGQPFVIPWQATDDNGIVSQQVELQLQGSSVVVAANLPGDQRALAFTVPAVSVAPGPMAEGRLVVRAVDTAGHEGEDDIPIVILANVADSDMTLLTSFAGQVFTAGDPIPDVFYTGTVSALDNVFAYVLFESEGVYIRSFFHDTGQHRLQFFDPFPLLSTDRARLVVEHTRTVGTQTERAYVFDSGYFSIRPDPRLGLVPPTVQLVAPTGGESFAAGSTVTVQWTASDDEALHSFDVLASYDGGRHWHLLARDLPAGTTSFDWTLPPAGQTLDDVRVCVVARDLRFENSSDLSGPFSITSGPTTVPGDIDGDGQVGPSDLGLLLSAWGTCAGDAGFNPAADVDGDGCIGPSDLGTLLGNWGG